jgi:membrane-associated phospholipid phosphatase
VACLLFFSLLCVNGLGISQGSPYEISRKRGSLFLGGGAVVGFVALSLENDVSPLTTKEIDELDRADINWLDRSATDNWSERASDASDILLYAGLLSPASLLLSEKVRDDLGTVGLMYAETLLCSALAPSIGKAAAVRTRPFVYNAGVPIEEKNTRDARRSFFSRHTTMAFSSAIFLASVYSEYNPGSRFKICVWGSSLVGASLVGLLRYESGAHFPTDVLTGVAVGSAIGYLIPYMHRTPCAQLELGFHSLSRSYGLGFTRHF